MITQRSYTLSGQSFACRRLKIVEIKCGLCDEVDGRAHKVLDILSTHGVPHEKVHIQRTIKPSESVMWVKLSILMLLQFLYFLNVYVNYKSKLTRHVFQNLHVYEIKPIFIIQLEFSVYLIMHLENISKKKS